LSYGECAYLTLLHREFQIVGCCVVLFWIHVDHALDLRRVYQGLNKLAQTGVRSQYGFRQW